MATGLLVVPGQLMNAPVWVQRPPAWTKKTSRRKSPWLSNMTRWKITQFTYIYNIRGYRRYMFIHGCKFSIVIFHVFYFFGSVIVGIKQFPFPKHRCLRFMLVFWGPVFLEASDISNKLQQRYFWRHTVFGYFGVSDGQSFSTFCFFPKLVKFANHFLMSYMHNSYHFFGGAGQKTTELLVLDSKN